LLAALGRTAIRGRRRRARWIPFRGQGKLLDFGCGRARFGSRMREQGWSVEGLDASAEVAAAVEREEGIRVHLGSLPHADLAPGSFDAVTMWSALEHVHEPRLVARAARQVLRPGGLLVVYVPNLASWSFRTFQEGWFGLDLPRHLTHFTPDTLTGLLAAERFRIVKVQTIGRDGWLRRSARRALESGSAPRWHSACRWKPLALAWSRWTEISGQAESILVLADRE
jgi:2-polyprenyl-3-methyl-5-hydroxy-6-metoxy-1,4-benzoquinol methylase